MKAKNIPLNELDIENKVIFCNPKSGHSGEGKSAKEYLKVGKEYTVSFIDMDASQTYINLKEVPGKMFNSVLFNIGPYEFGES